MQLDEIVRGGKRMVDGVPPGGEHRVVDSASYIDAVAINQEGTLSNRLLSSYSSSAFKVRAPWQKYQIKVYCYFLFTHQV
jgi:hypothetical protein